MKLTFEIIGSGGAFDTDKLNSSFIIHSNEDDRKILIDCGYNIFPYIKEKSYHIEDILITHTHFDHIGSLESLIFYNYFEKGIQTNVYSGPKVVERLKYILDVNKLYYNGEIIPTEICRIRNLDEVNINKFETIEMNHIVTPSYGFIFKGTDVIGNPKYIVISGDTKASYNLAKWIENIYKKENAEIIIFHDFSDWDNPLENIHCCKSDFDKTYLPLIEKYDNLKFIFYHSNNNIGYKEELFI